MTGTTSGTTAEVPPGITWTAPDAEHPARTAALRSMSAVVRGARDEWVALYAPDAVLEDPVGPSPLDPAGEGHHGQEAIAAFWDRIIAPVGRFEFSVTDSFAAGNEVANVGVISAFLPDGTRVDTEGVFVYRVRPDGLIAGMRAFWEVERAMRTMRRADGLNAQHPS